MNTRPLGGIHLLLVVDVLGVSWFCQSGMSGQLVGFDLGATRPPFQGSGL